jgi:hypothetical protein
MNFEISSYHQHINNTLRGFITLDFPDIGAEMPGFSYHVRNGTRWIDVPSRSTGNGQKEQPWEKVMNFYNKKLEKSFKNAILDALDKYAIENNIIL